MNRIRFRGRLHGHRLAPGVYSLRGRSHGRTVLRTKLVVRGVPTACLVGGGASADGLFDYTAAAAIGGSPKQPGAGSGGGPTGSSGATAAPAVVAPAPHPDRGVLGIRATKVIPGSGGTRVALLLVLLGAIVLLAIGAVPRNVVPHATAAAFLAERRTIIAAGGFAALAAFTISYFIA